ncbi:hypothetical protein [Streptomyces sp. H27-D2]|uniref:hypothetical protein n=1 Tax=Streptomyces sp. H27-D2 TaxID=3046304 RepID=UPI002DBFEF87|nr:hypothetical protein [Streptomyces sp. H27-D2]MEC4016282.1 hypothetical protein [Streptomyces sp. H27-D2]
MTFYGEWRRDHDRYPDGRAYGKARLAKPGVLTSFGYTDLIEDADGYLIAKAVKGGKNIADAFRRPLCRRRQPHPLPAVLQRAGSGTIRRADGEGRDSTERREPPVQERFISTR